MINKIKIAQSFSRAAYSYDNAAHMQRDVGDHLFSLINFSKSVDTILDVGCGTAFFTNKLADIFIDKNIIGLDIASGMLDFSKNKSQNKITWVCADAEKLPFTSNSVDLIFSNLTVQWCADFHAMLVDIKRVLKPGGIAFLSTLASPTLIEIKQAWQQIDSQSHVNNFLAVDELKKLINMIPYSNADISVERKSLLYDSPIDIMRELKALGAQQLTEKRAEGMMGKNRFNTFLKKYEKIKVDNQFPVTYEVVYIVLTK